MKMLIAGQWVESPEKDEIRNPYSGDVVDTVPRATPDQVEQCLAAAEIGKREMAALPAYKRADILNRAADLLQERSEDLAQTISLEMGKPITEARGEVGRMPDLLRLCAYEGAHLRGESLPIDAQRGAEGKMGFTWRVPCGIVVAISPFNFPLLLVIHKIGPALAAGNAVILKPAHQSPLIALKLTEILVEAGLPANALQCITGAGRVVGNALVSDSRVRKVTFTGSSAVGNAITQSAGVKMMSLELGSNCPMIVMPDADIEAVAAATAVGGYVNAGQVCVSVQRVLVHQQVYGDFMDALKPKVEAIPVGDQMQDDTRLSTMVSLQEAERVDQWLQEAVGQGASLVTGGERNGSVIAPTILADAKPNMRAVREELFGPAVVAMPFDTVEQGIALANDNDYGLSAGIFTNNLADAMRFAKEAEAGNIMINWSPLWRADLMPYGGFKASGIGKEGARYAVHEMTEIKNVVIHGLN